MTVSFDIQFPGASATQEELDALVQSMTNLSLAESEAKRATDAFNVTLQASLTTTQLAEARERGIAAAREASRDRAIAQAAAERGVSQARAEYADATRRAETATRQATAEQTAASTAAIQFTQRIAGAANAVQTLVGQLGGQSRAAGLAGAIANSTAHFAQLGAAVGPQGAIVGGIIGALIPAITALRQESDRAADAASALNVDLSTLIARAQQARQQMELTRRLESGQGTLEEQSAYQQQAQQNAEQYLAALRGDQGAIRAIRRRGVTGVADTEPGYLALAGQALGQLTGDDAPAVLLQGGERDLVETLLRGALRDAQHRADMISGTTDHVVDQLEQEDAARRHRGGGGGGGSARAAARGNAGVVGVGEEALQGRREELERADEARRMQEQREQRAAMHEEGQRQFDQQIEARHQILELTREQDRAEQDATDARKAREQTELERLHARKNAQEQATHQQIQGYQQVTGAIVGGIVQAGEALASGAEDAGQAFKHLLAGFLEMISQRAALEAAAEFASAIASFARYDYSGGAQHAAAGVAWTAVAVASGVGAGALNASAAQGAAASAGAGPARPPGQRDEGGGRGGNTYNIYYDSPVITAGTHSELARSMRNMFVASEARYPSG